MPKTGEPRGRTPSEALVPGWLDALRDVVNKHDPDVSARTKPMMAAIIHLGKHSVRVDDPPPPGAEKGVVRRIECALGETCKAYGASVAILTINEATTKGSDDVRAIAKAVSRARGSVRKAAREYQRSLKKYFPTREMLHGQYDGLAQRRLTQVYENLCRRPLLVLEHFRHFLVQTEEADIAILSQLSAPFRGPFSKKNGLPMLDVATSPLLEVFSDAEIDAMIPDGVSRGDGRQRVSNRRFKLTGSRTQPGDRKPSRSQG